MRALCDQRGIGLGKIIHSVRVAVTGNAVGFGMFEILEILGRASTLARIDRSLERLENAVVVAPDLRCVRTVALEHTDDAHWRRDIVIKRPNPA